MDAYLHGSVWHDDETPKALTEEFVAGEWILIGNQTRVELTYEITGTLIGSLGLKVETRDRLGNIAALDAQAYAGGGSYSVYERSYEAPGTIGRHMVTIMLPRWRVIRFLAKREGGDVTSAVLITGTARLPDT